MKQFGLIGYPLSHSFSKRFFTEKFSRENIIDCAYENYPLTDIAQFPDLLQSVAGLEGLNVTIPYKESVIPFLTAPDETVTKIGACNCIHLKNGNLYGYNTDVYGFERALKTKLLPHHTSALVLGTGGASKAVCFVLESLGISYHLVSRSGVTDNPSVLAYSSLTKESYLSHTLIINTTPVGMHPADHLKPPITYDWITEKHFLFDLIYNPEQTLFLKEGALKGAITLNGFDMLIFQAEKSWEIWNS